MVSGCVSWKKRLPTSALGMWAAIANTGTRERWQS